MSIFFGTSKIRDRVMAAINEKIDTLEKSYESDCRAIDAKAEEEKLTLLDSHVDAILGKII